MKTQALGDHSKESEEKNRVSMQIFKIIFDLRLCLLMHSFIVLQYEISLSLYHKYTPHSKSGFHSLILWIVLGNKTV